MIINVNYKFSWLIWVREQWGWIDWYVWFFTTSDLRRSRRITGSDMWNYTAPNYRWMCCWNNIGTQFGNKGAVASVWLEEILKVLLLFVLELLVLLMFLRFVDELWFYCLGSGDNSESVKRRDKLNRVFDRLEMIHTRGLLDRKDSSHY